MKMDQNKYVIFQEERNGFKIMMNPNIHKPQKDKKVTSRPIYVLNKNKFPQSVSKLPVEIILSSTKPKGINTIYSIHAQI